MKVRPPSPSTACHVEIHIQQITQISQTSYQGLMWYGSAIFLGSPWLVYVLNLLT